MEHGAWSMEHGAWSMEHGAVKDLVPLLGEASFASRSFSEGLGWVIQYG